MASERDNGRNAGGWRYRQQRALHRACDRAESCYRDRFCDFASGRYQVCLRDRDDQAAHAFRNIYDRGNGNSWDGHPKHYGDANRAVAIEGSIIVPPALSCGVGEFRRSVRKSSFVAALQRLVPAIVAADLVPGGSGVRAQAIHRSGTLVDDFQFSHSKNMLHLYNVPSPAATASIAIGRSVVELAARTFDWQ
jgi:hypothetical protein